MNNPIYKQEPYLGVANSLNNLGSAYENKGHYDLAIKYHEKSLKMSLAILGKDFHPAIADSLNNLGEAYRTKGQYETVPVESTVNEIVSLVNTMGLEVDNNDIGELVKE